MKLAALLYGNPGAGKTPAALTAPAPRLLLDAEGGANYAAPDAVMWDPKRDGLTLPMEAEGAATVRVFVRDFDTMRLCYQFLQQNPRRFRSVIVDSITETQKRCKDAMGKAQLQQQDWGALLAQMEGLVRSMRDMVTEDYFDVLVITATADEVKGFYRPAVQGGLAIQLPAHVALIGYLGTFRNADATKFRGMQIEGDDRFIAKDRTASLPGGGITGAYGTVIPAPINLAEIIEKIH